MVQRGGGAAHVDGTQAAGDGQRGVEVTSEPDGGQVADLPERACDMLVAGQLERGPGQAQRADIGDGERVIRVVIEEELTSAGLLGIHAAVACEVRDRMIGQRGQDRPPGRMLKSQGPREGPRQRRRLQVGAGQRTVGGPWWCRRRRPHPLPVGRRSLARLGPDR
jgi:hypothetical protein